MEKCIRFLVNAAKYTLAKREDARMNGLRRTKGIYDFHELKLRPFLNTLIRPGIIRSGTKISLLTEIRTGTLVELTRLFS